ncbi:hypothetical protein ACFOHY_01025 [Rhizobium rosettiformans]
MMCNCYASGLRKCSCGAVKDGVLVNGASLHIPVLMKDSATPQTRKELTMMTDAEIKSMRDSVRGMSVTQAAALPIFDNVRGLRACGMPAPEYYAMLYGATPASQAPNREAAQSRSYRDQMIEDMRNAYLEKPGSEAA